MNSYESKPEDVLTYEDRCEACNSGGCKYCRPDRQIRAMLQRTANLIGMLNQEGTHDGAVDQLTAMLDPLLSILHEINKGTTWEECC